MFKIAISGTADICRERYDKTKTGIANING
jgi:hypothetical protein